MMSAKIQFLIQGKNNTILIFLYKIYLLIIFLIKIEKSLKFEIKTKL